MSKAAKTPKEVQYWIMPVIGCSEPEKLIGPHKTYEEMIPKAKKVFRKQSAFDTIFWIRTGMGSPIVGAFTEEEIRL